MRRSYWMIALSFIILIIIGTVVTFFILTTPKAGAPSISNDIETTTAPLTIYYIASDDGGKSGTKIGCGDSMVATTTEDVTTSNVVKSAIERLLANKEQFLGESGLYNALYSSNLTYIDSKISDDTVTVNLTGKFSLAGECDNPRVQYQLEMTVKAAAGTQKVAIFVDGKTLSQVLSLK